MEGLGGRFSSKSTPVATDPIFLNSQNNGFIDQVQEFAREHKDAFAEEQGEAHSLEETRLHGEFQAQFEAKVSCYHSLTLPGRAT